MATRALIGLLAVLAACSRDATASSAAPPERASEGKHTVLLELFTSEGCSSCPPADRMIADLLESDTVDVTAIAFHVDYWNYLGWSDRFSSEAWSDRQQRYASASSTSRVYTPQVLVDGRDHRVGARGDAAHAAIRAAAERLPTAELSVTAARDGRSVDVRLTAKPAAPDDEAVVMVALVASTAQTDVPRGENAGRTLKHVAPALDLTEACRLRDAAAGCSAKLKVPRRLADEVGNDVEVVAFVQSPTTMAVGQSARVEIQQDLGKVVPRASSRADSARSP